MLLAGTGSGTLALVVIALLVGGVLVWQRRRMEEVTRRLEQRDEYRRPPAQVPGEAASESGESAGGDGDAGESTKDAGP